VVVGAIRRAATICSKGQIPPGRHAQAGAGRLDGLGHKPRKQQKFSGSIEI